MALQAVACELVVPFWSHPLPPDIPQVPGEGHVDRPAPAPLRSNATCTQLGQRLAQRVPPPRVPQAREAQRAVAEQHG